MSESEMKESKKEKHPDPEKLWEGGTTANSVKVEFRSLVEIVAREKISFRKVRDAFAKRKNERC